MLTIDHDLEDQNSVINQILYKKIINNRIINGIQN
jgi:hypothetical protein